MIGVFVSLLCNGSALMKGDIMNGDITVMVILMMNNEQDVSTIVATLTSYSP